MLRFAGSLARRTHALGVAVVFVSTSPMAFAQNPSLCISADQSCLALGGLTVRIELTPGSATIVGGQFSVRYNAQALELTDVAPGRECDPASPFTVEMFESANNATGEVFYAVVVNPLDWNPAEPQGPATLACMHFEVIGAPQGDICILDDANSASTILVDSNAHSVPIDNSGDCPSAAPGPAIACTAVEVDETCTCVGGTADCSALDTSCIEGVCDEVSGVCQTRLINNLGPCDDGDACTVSDMCVVGECVGFGCRNPSLCVVADEDCALPGDTVQLRIELGEGDRIITGGQFSLQYDPAYLEFVGMTPGATCAGGSPFGLELVEIVDEENGTIFYAVIMEPGVGSGTSGPATMACVDFVLHDAAGDGLCLLQGANPLSTVLVDDLGNGVQVHNNGHCLPEQDLPILSCDKPCIPIPTLSAWGLIILTLCLLLAAKTRFSLPLRS
ncbi:MAG: cohesin domain-containing protein [Phycisphaerae bacterium]